MKCKQAMIYKLVCNVGLSYKIRVRCLNYFCQDIINYFIYKETPDLNRQNNISDDFKTRENKKPPLIFNGMKKKKGKRKKN